MSAVAHVEPTAEHRAHPTAPMLWHDLANLFPMLEGEAFWALVEDVRANGVREPIVMFEGKVLDGRNRYMAAREAGVPYPVIEYEGDDPLGYVVSLNLKRRHLNESQRALVAGKLAKLPAHRPEVGKFAGIPTQPVAAEMLSVSERSVRHAAAVLDKGAPGLVASVEAGEVTVSAAAEVAKLPETVQAEVVALDAAAEVAREVRRDGAETVTAKLRSGDATTRSDVQGAIRALAKSGGPRPAVERPAPVVDDPAFAAMASVAGAATVIIERLSERGAAGIVAGFLDEAMKRRNVATFTRCRDALNDLLEACDAA